ncbi:hypothetical protein LEP1GSC016_1717 [Leptospira borgpetersenii serovar Hardjo-bovis str. Sponselee]|uniref:Uncharacterized protein n=1 Tax=Leptospira borgpetersenii serovar Hardjo-bovis str. Sponselee TaxID=1303729 RepID=M6BJH0_LEPBO|nr:hypothetical protein LEP1GSC016_1717 [Leptospira borgpetersenii serovar Hardjo-bovis str. Sponselee]
MFCSLGEPGLQVHLFTNRLKKNFFEAVLKNRIRFKNDEFLN